METTNVINLTPHTVTVFDRDIIVLSIESSGVARVSATTDVVGQIRVGDVIVPRTHTVYGQVEGLPAPTPGTIYILYQA